MELNYKIYTPEKYSENIAEIALNRYFKNYGKTSESLEKIKVLDLSCGSGNLLLSILERLLIASREIYGTYKFCEKWITGYDIDKKALEIFNERAKALFFKYGLEKKELNLKNKDSLQEDFVEKYSIVLGNPPYLGEKNHKDIFHALKETIFGEKYYRPKMDYFYYFILKGIEVLEKDGILVYLTTNYWLKADSAELLRTTLRENGDFFRIENYNYSLFKSAIGQHNIVFSWNKIKSNENIEVYEENIRYEMNQEEIYFENNKIALIPKEKRWIIDQIRKKSSCTLNDLVNINQGIVSGADKVYVFEKKLEGLEEYFKPFYKNKDIGAYSVTEKPPFWIIYLSHNSLPNEKLLNYLEQHREILEKRREVVRERIKWWELQWSRDEEIFLKPKIVVRQRCKTNNFAYTEKPFYGSADIYYLTGKNDVDILYLLGYLNSKLFYIWYRYMGKSKGKNLEFYSTPLKEVPVYYPNKEERDKIVKLVKKQLENYTEEIQKEIDEYFFSILI